MNLIALPTNALVFCLIAGVCLAIIVLGFVLLGFIVARITDPEAYEYDDENDHANIESQPTRS